MFRWLMPPVVAYTGWDLLINSAPLFMLYMFNAGRYEYEVA